MAYDAGSTICPPPGRSGETAAETGALAGQVDAAAECRLHGKTEVTLGNLVLANRVIAAPMAGISNKAFRVLAREFGAALTYTEMISARGLLSRNRRTLAMLDFSGEDMVGAQLFGADPGEMAAAAELAVEHGAVVIDINMGCPVPKVVKGGAGAALLQDLPRARAIVAAVVRAVGVPVTVKMRRGWRTDEDAAVALARDVAGAGAAAVTIHGRAREDFYHGRADWGIVARVKRAVSIPVIGNGDVFQAGDAVRLVDETRCDAVMVARGALGNPWLFHACAAALAGEAPPPLPSVPARLRVAGHHLEMLIQAYGEDRGLLQARKHLSWYVKGLPGAAHLRQEIFTLRSVEEARAWLAGQAAGAGIEAQSNFC